jgi:hypothetical protein
LALLQGPEAAPLPVDVDLRSRFSPLALEVDQSFLRHSPVIEGPPKQVLGTWAISLRRCPLAHLLTLTTITG